tara:strand:+ start:1175 stop:1288 length:114 start_codon:yes stop_codon:yes gene_type:complete
MKNDILPLDGGNLALLTSSISFITMPEVFIELILGEK